MTSPSNILEGFNFVMGSESKPPQATAASPSGARGGHYRLILQNLSLDPVPIDVLALECQVTAALVQPALADLEMAGLIERHPGGRISKTA